MSGSEKNARNDEKSVLTPYKDDAPDTWKRYINAGTEDHDFAIGSLGYGKGSQYIQFQIDQGTGYKGWSFRQNNVLNDNQWHHVVVTRSGKGNQRQLAIYLDGVALRYHAEGGAGIHKSTTIGSSAGNQYLDGAMDEVAFFSTDLSASEVKELYNAAR